MRAGKARSGLRAGLAGHRRWPACGKHLPFGPEVGAVCGKAARTVLCGGRSVMSVPTASGLPHFWFGSKPEFTAPQQQRPLHLNRQTLCTRQIIGSCAGSHIPVLYGVQRSVALTHSSLWPGRLNVSLGEIITTKPVGNQSRTPDEPREPSTRMFRLR
jgi:hypothetical protein